MEPLFILMVFPAGLLAGGLYQLIKDLCIERNKAVTEGEIRSLEVVYGARGRASFDANVWYSLDGNEYENTVRLTADEIINYKVGDRILLVCQKNAPLNLRTADHPMKRDAFILIGAAVFFAVIYAITILSFPFSPGE